MAALLKGARPGRSCSSERGVCPNSTSCGAVSARGSQHLSVGQGWMTTLAIFGVTGVRFSHMGRAASLDP